MNRWKFDQVMELNGQPLTKAYVAGLDKAAREDLVEPIFQMIRQDLPDFPYPDDLTKVDKEWKRVVEYKPDLTKDEIYNNSSVATYIGKYFCKDFWSAIGSKKSKTMIEVFHDDNLMHSLITNRLGINWFEQEPFSTFSLTPKMLNQGIRSMHLTSGNITVFKPTVAKYLTMKYSQPGNTIYDYSAGWGARMLGAVSCGRKYIGVDPLTTDDLIRMRDYLKLKDATLYKEGSEDHVEPENVVDFSYSSPPYYDQEVYSSDTSQAYNNGPERFFSYWSATLKNVKYMLKKDGYFGLVLTNQDRMLEMAKEQFGEVIETVKLKTVKSHLNKSKLEEVIKKDPIKYESVFIFKNEK